MLLVLTVGSDGQVWDHASAVVCVEEAGGRVSDMYQQPLLLRGRSFAPDGLAVVRASSERVTLSRVTGHQAIMPVPRTP